MSPNSPFLRLVSVGSMLLMSLLRSLGSSASHSEVRYKRELQTPTYQRAEFCDGLEKMITRGGVLLRGPHNGQKIPY